MRLSKLIHLEMKKCNYLQCLLFAVATFVGIYILVLASFMPETSRDYSTYIFVLNNTMLFDKYAWTIFGAVLVSKLYSEEIALRTTNILFTYPISRCKICTAKYIFIFQFVIIGFCISAILHGFIILKTNQVIPFLTDFVDMTIFPQYILSAIINSVFVTLTMFITLFVNAYTKSTKVTLVCTVILIIIVYQGVNSTAFIGKEMILFGIMSFLGALCSFLGIRKINCMDL